MSFPDVPPYPQQVLDLQTPEGFENAFHVMWGTDAYKTRESCYEDLESTHEHYYGKRRYEDYNSFRVSINYRHKKRKAKR